MKHTTHFFTFLVLFITSVMFVMPVNAIVYEGLVDTPIGMGFYDVETILVCEDSSPSGIVFFYPEGLGSTSTKITSITNVEDAVVGQGNEIFFILTDGLVYRFLGGAGVYDFVTDYNTSFQLLGDMDGQNSDRDITVDFEGNVYTAGYNTVQRFQYPSYTKSTLITMNETSCVSLHPDGLIFADSHDQSSGQAWHFVYLWDGSSFTLLYQSDNWSGLIGRHGAVKGLYATSSGDIYINRYGYNGNELRFGGIERLNYSDNYAMTVFEDLDTIDIPMDIFIDNNAVLYTCDDSDSSISTYTTVGTQTGYGYIYYEGSTGEQQLDYDVTLLNSLYTAYNNDSNIELSYSIDIDLVQGLTTQDFYDENGNSQYYWTVDVLDTDGIKQKTTIINSFDKDYDIVSGWHIISIGNLQYSSSAWKNGTWSAILYEYNMNTGLRAALDDCEFEIYNQVSDTIVSDETPEIDPALDPVSRIDALLESNAFIGLLIILACMAAFGKVGGVVGLVLGTVAGVSLAFLLNYIPAWVLFLMVLALCVVFVSKLISGFGGNN